MIDKNLVTKSERIARIVPHVLEQRGIEPVFTDWVLTQSETGLTWLFGALDVRRITRLEQYVNPDLVHQVSTVCRGVPVYTSNTSGLRYGFLLSGRPRLPGRAGFPGIERGMARLGVGLGGEVRTSWDKLGHLLVAGMTGAGKSVMLRLLVHQAVADGARLLLADLDGATFPMLQGHSALLAPIAGNPSETHQVVGLALGECDRRAALYQVAGGYPENLNEYNASAAKSGGEVLPRVLVILDEFNATVVNSGGATGAFAGDVAALAWRGRKFGINLVVAAQDFAKAVVGRMRDQLTPILFHVQSKELARAVNCSPAYHFTRPGRAISPRWGKFQAYYLDKAELAGATAGAGILSNAELDMIRWAIEHNDGYLSLADIQERAHTLARAGACAGARAGAREDIGPSGRGYSRRLAADWENRGWLQKDTTAGNKRRITDELRQIACKLETLQSLETVGVNPQACNAGAVNRQVGALQTVNRLETDPGPLAGIKGTLDPIVWR